MYVYCTYPKVVYEKCCTGNTQDSLLRHRKYHKDKVCYRMFRVAPMISTVAMISSPRLQGWEILMSRSELGHVWNSLIPTVILRSSSFQTHHPTSSFAVFSRAYVSRLFLAYSIAAENKTNSSCHVRSTPFHCDGH